MKVELKTEHKYIVAYFKFSWVGHKIRVKRIYFGLFYFQFE
jgi:hypothetical protein